MDGSQSNPELCNIPAGIPPYGTSTDFDDPVTLTPVLISVCVLTNVWAVLFTACRLIANRRNLSWSDYFSVVSLPLFMVFSGLVLSKTKFARHLWDIRLCLMTEEFPKFIFVGQVTFSFSLLSSKLSIFWLYHQIFQSRRQMKIAIRLGIAACITLYLSDIVICAVLSAPRVGETWLSVPTSGRYEQQLVWGMALSALGTILDLIMFTLPIRALSRLHLSLKKRLQLAAVFATALIGIVASVLSLVYRTRTLNSNDGTWNGMSLIICTVVENDAAIIVSCAPGFANFCKVYLSKARAVAVLHHVPGTLSGKRRRMGSPEDLIELQTGDDAGKLDSHEPGASEIFALNSRSNTSQTSEMPALPQQAHLCVMQKTMSHAQGSQNQA